MTKTSRSNHSEALLKLSADHNRTQERIRPSSTRLGKRKSPATPPDSNSTDGSSPGADGGDRLQEDRGIGSSSSRRRSMRQKKSHPSKGSARRSFYAEIPEGADEDSDGFEMLESNDKTPPPKLADATGDVNGESHCFPSIDSADHFEPEDDSFRLLFCITGDSLFMCPSCNYIFTQSALMRHTDEKMMMCSPDDPEPTLAERGLNPTAPVAGGNSRGSGKLDSFFKKPNQSHTLTPMGAALDAEGSSSDSRGLPFPPSSQRHVMPSSSRSDRDCERGQREVQITVVQAPQPKRLHRPDFGKKKDKDLKLLCREYGIAETGGKPRMIERLREWINLYNGNLDASEANRKDARDLRKELKEWERRLDSLKEMDAAGRSEKIHHSSWVQTHREEFWRLTRLAVVSATKARLGAERERRREAVPESEQDDDRQHVIISRDGSLLPE